MLLKKFLKGIYAKLPISWSCFILSRYTAGNIQLDKSSYIHPSVHLLGKSNIKVGKNSCISEGGWMNVNHRVNNDVAIHIGDNCFIGKQNFFTSGKKIVIGDYTLTTIGCRFIGSSHHIDNPMYPYLMTGTTDSESIIVGVNCFIGAGASILGNVKVGYGSVIGATALVLSDIPPFSVAVGNPAKVLKRYSFISKSWVAVADFLEKDEAAIPTEKDYLNTLKKTHPKLSMPWIAAGKSLGDI